MPQNYNSRFLETIGLELEGEVTDRNAMTTMSVNKFDRLGQRMPYQIHRDASTESTIDQIIFRGNQSRHFQVNTHNRLYKKLMRPTNPSTGGYELIFNPMTLEELRPAIYKVENILQELGDSPTDRSAIHFHIGFAHNLKLMKRILTVCLKLDPLLFRLGGFGRTFRGKSNKAAYARPLLNSAAIPMTGPARLDARPPRNREPWDDEEREQIRATPMRNSGRYVQAINPLGALNATTTDGFWANFSVHPSITGIPKYHPCRYTGSNAFAILAHGTMEFRHFNQVIDAEMIYTTAKFLRAIVDLSTELTKPELAWFNPIQPENEISMDDVAEIMWQLGRFFTDKEIVDSPTTDEMEYLTRVIDESHFASLPETPVLSHIRDFMIPENLAIGLKRVESPLEPSHIDIHNIADKISSILPGEF